MMGGMFVPLACHSAYSLMWGTASIEALCGRAKAEGMSVLALTDREGLYGILPFWEVAQGMGLRPIIGAHLPDPYSEAFLLVAGPQGYRRLSRILTRYHQEGQGFSLLRDLKEDRRELVVLSPSAPFLQALAQDSGTEGLYIALYPYGPQRELIQCARHTGIPLAAVAPVYFLDHEDYRLHRLLRAIALCTKLDRVPAKDLAPAWAWVHTTHEWTGRYLHCPQALKGMQTVAEQCQMQRPPWGEWIFPPFEALSGQEAFALLKEKALSGVARRYGDLTRAIEERLTYELSIIRSKGLASYFLVVEDIVRRFPITCGRGSAAASLVSYCLGITHVDPLRHNLFFERFLNTGRNDPPDIDVDFPWDERDAVLAYVLERYGPERCAMVANHVGFGIRAAVREVAKVYGVPEEEIQKVSHGVSRLWDPLQGEGELLDHPVLQQRLLEAPWPAILTWARRLEGIPRHLSVHCGGVVITPDPLPERVPVEQAAKGVPVIQWEKDGTEAAGLVKIDLLGNRSLAVIRDVLASIKENYGVCLSYPALNPLEDPTTCQMLARGDTGGVFYVESPAMRQLLKKTGKGDFAHLVVQSSIIRPAANEYIREYVRRVRGGGYTPLHPLLEGILEETHGVPCYQEDVSRMAMALAGFDAVQADELRKILSKKHKHRQLADVRGRFFEGAKAREVPAAVIEEVWRMILSFQGYSFCKPHSASYALVSFKACYLKAHYPAEFMAAVLSNQGGYYSPMAYLSEARRRGLAILPPDINASALQYTGCGQGLRVGLMQLKGIGRDSLEAILEERRRRGPFTSFEETPQRTDIDPGDLRILIKAGCMDSIARGRSRPQLIWQLLAWEAGQTGKGGMRKTKGEDSRGGRRKGKRDEACAGPAPILFTGTFKVPQVLPYDPELCLRHEIETLGLLISRHPLELYRPLLSRIQAVPAIELPRHVGRRASVIGWFVTGKTVASRQNEPMEFVSFEDTTALYETTFFPRAYRRFCHLLSYSRPYILRGLVEEDFGAISITVEDVTFLPDMKNALTQVRCCSDCTPKGVVSSIS